MDILNFIRLIEKYQPYNFSPTSSRNPYYFDEIHSTYWNNEKPNSSPHFMRPSHSQSDCRTSTDVPLRKQPVKIKIYFFDSSVNHPYRSNHSRKGRGLHSSLRIYNSYHSIHRRNQVMTIKYNPYHLVQQSPWPLTGSLTILGIVRSAILFLNKTRNTTLLLFALLTRTLAFLWWRDIHRESSEEGNHPKVVVNGLKTGIILFIASEVLFFVSFFWSFFHRRFSPTIELGQMWPPHSIRSFNPIRIPLLNTILLLSSGVSVTWSHHEILKSNFNRTKKALLTTIYLGVIFSVFQGFEYKEAPFSISDSTFGTTFFIATGFHGTHVLIGTLFLLISLSRFSKIINSRQHIVGFECAAWYWHFVDVVWLFLYTIIYWWGAYL